MACTKMILSSAGLFNNNVVVRKIPNSKKEIYFIELKHVAQQEFYNGVLKTIDSFKNEGFYILTEGVKARDSNMKVTSKQDTTNVLKFRKILGLIPQDLANGEGFKEIAKKYKLVSQPMLINLNSPATEKIADVSVDEMIQKYEAEKGVIVLEDCDYKTTFKEKYECNEVSKENKKYFTDNVVLKFRDSVIASKTINQPQLKILMVYGAEHFSGLNKIISNQ